MEQSESPQNPEAVPPPPAAAPPPAPPPVETPPEPAAERPPLPDPKGMHPIPDQFRLPFTGKMISPTAVPSATERRRHLDQIQKRRKRRGFLIGLLVGQLLIIALDLGGPLILRLNPQVKIQAPIGIPSIVFLGMAAGAAILLGALVLIYLVMAIRAIVGKSKGRIGQAGRGVKRIVLATLALGVSISVICGTGWFMIPRNEWKPTVEFAKDLGLRGLTASKQKLRSMFSRSP